MSRPSSSKNYNFAFPLVTCGCLSVSREPRRYPCHLRTVWLRLRHSKSWVNGQLSSCPGCVQRLSHSHIIHIWIFQFSIFTIVCYLCVTYCPQIVPFIFGRHRWSPKFKIHIIPHRSTKVHAPGHLQLCWPPLPLLASHLPGDPFVSVDRYDAETFVTDWRARRRSPRETHLSRLRSVSEHALGVLEKCATITCIWWSEE